MTEPELHPPKSFYHQSPLVELEVCCLRHTISLCALLYVALLPSLFMFVLHKTHSNKHRTYIRQPSCVRVIKSMHSLSTCWDQALFYLIAERPRNQRGIDKMDLKWLLKSDEKGHKWRLVFGSSNTNTHFQIQQSDRPGFSANILTNMVIVSFY